MIHTVDCRFICILIMIAFLLVPGCVNSPVTGKPDGTGEIPAPGAGLPDLRISSVTVAEGRLQPSKRTIETAVGINGASLSPQFNGDTREYTATVEDWMAGLTVNATSEDEKHYLVQYSTPLDPVFRNTPCLNNMRGFYRIDLPMAHGQTITLNIKVMAENRESEMV